eukprot:15355942-Ditylum_brightwellii.AAC.2
MDDHPLPLEAIPEEENEGLAAVNDQAELLQWHYHLGHLSFCKIHLLSLVGIFPRCLAKIRPPKCAGYMYMNMTRKAWRIKTKQNRNKIMKATEPGQVVSLDQLESTTPGFVAQLKGTLMTKSYKAATVFIDHFSNATFIYVKENLDAEQTLAAKSAFKAW